jgi:hypothetical protein
MPLEIGGRRTRTRTSCRQGQRAKDTGYRYRTRRWQAVSRLDLRMSHVRCQWPQWQWQQNEQRATASGNSVPVPSAPLAGVYGIWRPPSPPSPRPSRAQAPPISLLLAPWPLAVRGSFTPHKTQDRLMRALGLVMRAPNSILLLSCCCVGVGAALIAGTLL